MNATSKLINPTTPRDTPTPTPILPPGLSPPISTLGAELIVAYTVVGGDVEAAVAVRVGLVLVTEANVEAGNVEDVTSSRKMYPFIWIPCISDPLAGGVVVRSVQTLPLLSFRTIVCFAVNVELHWPIEAGGMIVPAYLYSLVLFLALHSKRRTIELTRDSMLPRWL